MPAEMPEHRPGLGARQMAAVLTAGDRGCEFDDGDAGDLEVMGRLGPDQGANPGAPDLDHMALD
jgi:hypothetical protein